MISDACSGRVACPVCLEPDGCAACARPGPTTRCTAATSTPRARGCACGGPDKVRLVSEDDGGLCVPVLRQPLPGRPGRRATSTSCPRSAVGEGHSVRRPRVPRAPGRHRRAALLSARVKADMMRADARPAPGRRRARPRLRRGQDGALRRRAAARRAAGIDVAPFFLARAARDGGPGAGRPAAPAVPEGHASRAPTPSTCSSTSTRTACARCCVEARRTLAARRPPLRLHPRHGVVAAGLVPARREPAGAAPGRARASSTTSARPCARATTATRSAATSTSTRCARRPGSRWPSAATTTSSSRRWSRTWCCA